LINAKCRIAFCATEISVTNNKILNKNFAIFLLYLNPVNVSSIPSTVLQW
jgi:hypothetical protein